LTERRPGAQRKLTTVLCADVQGYTRLMGADEEGTFATLKAYRDAIARIVATYGGRIVNTWGDAVIAEFPSVVESVRAAIDIQNDLAARNMLLAESRRLVFRIGINLGDVLIDGGDIYGDGVNIAARLQSAAAPGGILISRTVHDQVRNKLAVGFAFLGELSVKNVDESVPSFVVLVGDSATQPQPSAPAPDKIAISAAAPPGRRRLGPTMGTIALVAMVLVAINLLASPEEFWAAWPLLGLALAAALAWTRRQTTLDRRYAGLAVIGGGLVGLNLLSWSGQFWAVWPLLGLAVLAGIRWLRRNAA
jgi:class 3 adenylate cyclase